MRYLSVNTESPVIIDAGANIGQSVHRFKELFPGSKIHSFEPSPATFGRLRDNTHRYSGVFTTNCGLGSEPGELPLLENSYSDMSSFLRPGRLAWGEVITETVVPVITVDDYVDREGISSVEILKIDTQGFDLEVLKGTSRLIVSHRVHLVYLELIFGPMYEGIPSYIEVLSYLASLNLQLVCFYRFHFQDDVASWSDALFIDPLYQATT
jgi:FkbM family methyltransferase